MVGKIMNKDNSKYLINGEKVKWEVVIGLEFMLKSYPIQNFFQALQQNLEANLTLK